MLMPRALILTTALMAGSFHLGAEDGVFPDRLVVGQAAALDGPAAALGTGMRDGLTAAFAEANAAGGVHGRRIELVSRDDGYDPERSIAQTRALIEEDKVFALIGPVGTPTAQAALPVAEKAGVPVIAPFTGAGFLRDAAAHPSAFNFRASYGQEMEAQAGHLVDGMKLTRIACFYQNDGFGQAGLNGITAALKKRNMELVATGQFERNTLAVKSGLLAIRKADPEAVVMVGPYAPCAEFIRLARKAGLDKAVFTNVSFVGTDALIAALGAEGEGVIISQVVPLPTDTAVPAVAAFHKAMEAAAVPADRRGFVSLEGYLAGRMFLEALRKIEGEPTRAALTTALGGLQADLGGVTVTFGPGDNQGCEGVWLTRISGGAATAVAP